MKIICDGLASHLSYCTNIHSGDSWQEVFPQLENELPKVRRELAFLEGRANDEPMGMGLRLSHTSLEALQDPNTFSQFKDWLARENQYVFTINGFSHGPFHGEQIKENVYKPDWTEQARLDYTCKLSRLMAALSPPDNYGSISTVAGTYKDWVMPGTVKLMADMLVQAVAHNVQLEKETGVRIALALEPEPGCFLETIVECVAFFKQHLYTNSAVNRLASLTGMTKSEADTALHEMLGVCYDVCHSAVEFENPAHAITRLQTAGIAIIKMQLSSALRIPKVTEINLRQLAQFDEPVYLHQVVEKRGKQFSRHNDLRHAIKAARYHIEQRAKLDPTLYVPIDNGNLALALSDFQPAIERDAEWRVHFHVPVFLEKMTHFSTTQSMLEQILTLQKRHGISPHLEVETYTWDVLPEAYRNVPVSHAIARELHWVRARL